MLSSREAESCPPGWHYRAFFRDTQLCYISWFNGNSVNTTCFLRDTLCCAPRPRKHTSPLSSFFCFNLLLCLTESLLYQLCFLYSSVCLPMFSINDNSRFIYDNLLSVQGDDKSWEGYSVLFHSYHLEILFHTQIFGIR